MPLASVLRALKQAFEGLGLRWYVFGAQAAILYGASRLTADIDVTVELGTTPIAQLLHKLQQGGFELRIPDSDGFVERTRVLPIYDSKSRIPVDIVLAGPGLEELFLQRASEMIIDNATIPVARAEDLVAMKLLAGRPKDIDDVAAIIAAQESRIDVALIRDTLRILEQALDQTDLMPQLERILKQVGQ
ncbi:MAG: nucleotidyl transferase AbiEii/AbiGii toxin family protein [Myxococcales bacterium]|nr:nucleotidyl transferase AbiEii/AbiGii toxin family protein [Myxococcales bacterium]